LGNHLQEAGHKLWRVTNDFNLKTAAHKTKTMISN
jgi:hypothetical protein